MRSYVPIKVTFSVDGVHRFDRSISALDVVRGCALAGVLLANLLFAFRVPTSLTYFGRDPADGFADNLTEALVQVAIQGKAITLFCFLFGVGLAIQHERFSRVGHPRRWLAAAFLIPEGRCPEPFPACPVRLVHKTAHPE